MERISFPEPGKSLRHPLQPGKWNVKLELPAGFKPPKARDVEIKAGETTEIVFDLERAD